jgi:hypothetical protein
MRHQQSISFSFLEDLRVPRSRKICAGGGALSSNCAVAPFVSLKSNVFAAGTFLAGFDLQPVDGTRVPSGRMAKTKQPNR